MTLYASLHCECFSGFDCVLMILRILRNTGQPFFFRMSCKLGFSGIFLMVPRGYGFGRREIKLHSHCITSKVHSSSTQFITVAVSLDHLAEAQLARLFHCKITPLPCPNCTLWKSKGVHLDEDCNKH